MEHRYRLGDLIHCCYICNDCYTLVIFEEMLKKDNYTLFVHECNKCGKKYFFKDKCYPIRFFV